jgi:hypothetical protein
MKFLRRTFASSHIPVITGFCNPLRCCAYRPGMIVRLTDPEFLDDPAQIVAIDPSEGDLTVKLWPHIDDPGLKSHQLFSQRALNSRMPPL